MKYIGISLVLLSFVAPLVHGNENLNTEAGSIEIANEQTTKSTESAAPAETKSSASKDNAKPTDREVARKKKKHRRRHHRKPSSTKKTKSTK